MEATETVPRNTGHSSVYAIVTEKIIEQLETGVAPWQKPWHAGIPRNLASRKPYRGINVFLLASLGYGSPYWCTFKQAKAAGGYVRKGEHGSQITFYKFDKWETEDADGETIERTSALLRYYTVFNAEQCEGIETPEPVRPANPIGECEAIVAGMPNPPAREQSDRAWYRPSTDSVGMPARSAFDSAQGFYSTLFHELTHSTGHSKRVGREGIENLNEFGSESYSREELVAEMGAAMLAGVAGIERSTLANSAAYLKSWVDVLKSDSRMVVSAASQAQKAADYILGNTEASAAVAA